MKKFLLSIFLFCSFALHALPLGNPAEPGLFENGLVAHPKYAFGYNDYWSLRIGYYGDFVYNRKLRVEAGAGATYGRNIRKTEIFTNSGYLALNLFQRADIFATLGATKINLELAEGAWAPPLRVYNSTIEANMSEAFSWSVGGRFLLLSWHGWKVGLEGQYFSARPHVTDAKILIAGGEIFYFKDKATHYYEKQFGAGISYVYAFSNLSLVPYAGIKWAASEFITHNFRFNDIRNNPFIFRNTQSRSHWGYAIGLSLVLNRSLELNAETRWGDERALTFKGQFQF